MMKNRKVIFVLVFLFLTMHGITGAQDVKKADLSKQSIVIRDTTVIQKVTDAQVKAVIKILGHSIKGETEEVLIDMNRFKFSLVKFQSIVADIVYGTVYNVYDEAEKYFKTSQSDRFEYAESDFRIERKDFESLRLKLEKQIALAYKDRGGMETFNFNRKIVERYKQIAWRELKSLYTIANTSEQNDK